MTTVVFRIGTDGNGTVYYNKTLNEIIDLENQYKNAGWKVKLLNNRQSTMVSD